MKKSAGILIYKIVDEKLMVLLAHPGGPFWKNKDLGAWTIPKGEFENEDPFDAAKREFFEETNVLIEGNFIPLAPQKLKSGKTVFAWACECDLDPNKIKSNVFELEWPPKSGKKQTFPEIDKAEWFLLPAAIEKINEGQIPFLHELSKKLNFSELASSQLPLLKP